MVCDHSSHPNQYNARKCDKMTRPFLMNYFYSIMTPTNVFKGRKYLSWPKMLLIFIFLVACMMVPTSISMVRGVTGFHFEYLMPNVSGIINDEFAEELSAYKVINGTLEGSTEGFSIEQGNNLLAIDFQGEYEIEGSDQTFKVAEFDNAIVFTKDYIVVADENGFGFQLTYPTSDRYPFEIESADDVLDYIGTIWYAQNKSFIFPIMVALVAVIFFIINIMQLIFMSVILWLTRKSQLTHISTFKEAFNLSLNSLGLPTMLAMLYGFFQFNIATMIAIQSLGAVLMLAFSFFRTRFNENYLENRK